MPVHLRKILHCGKRLANPVSDPQISRMPLPNEPVTLSPEQVNELRSQLSTMRHDINNNLSLIVAAAELIKINPESAGRMATSLNEQPGKIAAHIGKFSEAFEKSLGLQRE